MEKLLFSAVILLFLLSFSSGCSLPIPEPDISLRPVSLEIVDEKTGNPIPGINVYQVLSTDIYGGCWNFFISMCPTNSNYWSEHKISNDLGIVVFNEKTLDLTCDEHPTAEYFIINMGIKHEEYNENYLLNTPKDWSEFFMAYSSFHKRLILIEPRYKGLVIYGNSYEIKNQNGMFKGDQGHFDVKINSKGYSNGPQKIKATLKQPVGWDD